jgi:hypothetical protein
MRKEGPGGNVTGAFSFTFLQTLLQYGPLERLNLKNKDS